MWFFLPGQSLTFIQFVQWNWLFWSMIMIHTNFRLLAYKIKPSFWCHIQKEIVNLVWETQFTAILLVRETLSYRRQSSNTPGIEQPISMQFDHVHCAIYYYLLRLGFGVWISIFCDSISKIKIWWFIIVFAYLRIYESMQDSECVAESIGWNNIIVGVCNGKCTTKRLAIYFDIRGIHSQINSVCSGQWIENICMACV